MNKCRMILLLVLCCGCSRGKYYVSNNFRNGPPADMNSIALDTSYHFYMRQVYKDKDENSQNILSSNVSQADTANKVRIEVEYLLVSWLYKNVIYISTVPDKFQYYYSKYDLPDTVINAFDFSSFHFGKLHDDGEMIDFVSENKMTKVSWQIKPVLNSDFPKQIFLRELLIEKKNVLTDVILVEKTLLESMVFTKQPGYVIVFSKPSDIGNADSLTGCQLLDNRIYFDHSKRGFNLYFRFTRNINTTDSTISFGRKRTLYDPDPLVAPLVAK